MTFSDSRISKFLQENFIVQWEAVSPVRLVKFDLGEGRSFSGTVNGEIALYFCDAHGKVFDILPALQSPVVTLTRIKEAYAFFTIHAGKTSNQAVREDTNSKFQFGFGEITDEMIETHVAKSKNSKREHRLFPIFHIPQPGKIDRSSVQKLHRDRLKKVANERYETLVIEGDQVLRDPTNIPAALLFPDTKNGEERRTAYIKAAVDEATRDLRTMVMSKSGPPPTYFNQHTFTNESLTVVEPGGLGYYQWQIDRAFFGHISEEDSMMGADMTPEAWKAVVFTTIMKQELKGGVVEYNSESLDAIQVTE